MRSDRWAIGGMLTVVVSLVVGGMSAIMDDRSGPALWMILGMGAMGVWAAARSSTLTVLFPRSSPPWRCSTHRPGVLGPLPEGCCSFSHCAALGSTQ